MNKKTIFLTAFIALACFVNVAKATTVLNVNKDGYIDDFTTSPSIPPDGVPDRTSDTNALLASRGVFSDFNVDSRAIMTFDISSFAGQHLTSAFLTGYGTRVDNGGLFNPIDGKFYLYSGDGQVGLNDFDSPAVFLGNVPFQANPSGFDLIPFQLNVTSALQQLVAYSDHFAEFRVKTNSPTVFINAGEVDPLSGFNVDTRWPGPQLALTTNGAIVTPEPASMILFGMGGMTMAFCRFRSKKRKAATL